MWIRKGYRIKISHEKFDADISFPFLSASNLISRVHCCVKLNFDLVSTRPMFCFSTLHVVIYFVACNVVRIAPT